MKDTLRIDLRSGGFVAIDIECSLVTLSQEDRAFLFEVVDVVKAYIPAEPGDGAPPGVTDGGKPRRGSGSGRCPDCGHGYRARHHQEECKKQAASTDKDSSTCPRCGGTLIDEDGDSVCLQCGHRDVRPEFGAASPTPGKAI